MNEKPELINAPLRSALRLQTDAPIDWLSPLKKDDYAEYRDEPFLKQVGVEPSLKSLSDFWPKRGPQWDALSTFGERGVILVEAKAHVDEMLSPPSQASPDSLNKIKKALNKTKRFYQARPGCDWTKRFYQYVNRLAHLYFLRELNGIDAYLVFVYFLNDPDLDGPKTEREWRAAIKVLHEALGLRGNLPEKYVIDVFVDVGALV